jgi:hypothetical protein
MTRGRIALSAILLCAVLLAAFGFSRSERRERPPLMVLTSLPLLFGEQFSVEASGSPTLDALQKRYRVIPISVTDPAELGRGRIWLMAHPRAQRPEDLVALDQWVRRGGRLLLLADPMLEWPSALPLGDPARPPPMFADTGLLAHWGLRLDSPDSRGPAKRELDGRVLGTVSPGSLFGRCDVSRDRLVARCRLGAGRATVIADADFLNEPDGPGALLEELTDLERS